MKKAIKEINQKYTLAKIIVVHGLTVSGETEGDDRIDEIEDMLDEVVKVTDPGSTAKIEIDYFKILGKLGDKQWSHSAYFHSRI